MSETSLTLTTTKKRTAWLEHRRTLIGGTDAAKLLGVSKWGGPMDVYLDKLGLLPERADSMPMESGRRFERPILEWYSDAKNCPILFNDDFEITKSPQGLRIGATLDARRMDVSPYPPIDAKNLRFAAPEWGEPETDQMPIYYAAQLVVQMHVTGAPYADLAVVFSGQDFRVYRLWRDEETEANIVGQCQRFWDDHIAKQIPPAVDGSPAYAEYLKKLVRQTTEEVVAATPEIHQSALALASVKVEEERIAAEKMLYENQIKAFIGEAKKVVGANWSATYGFTKDTIGTDWEAIARNLADELSRRVGNDSSPELVLASRLPQFQKVTRTGGRQFRFTIKGQS